MRGSNVKRDTFHSNRVLLSIVIATSVLLSALRPSVALALPLPPNTFCQVWTDWRDTCSVAYITSSGRYAQPVCVHSANVTASQIEKPKCLRYKVPPGFQGAPATNSGGTSRYCLESSTSDTTCVKKSGRTICSPIGGGKKTSQPSICSRWDGDGPLGWSDLRSLDNQWCKQWAGHNEVCSRNVKGGLTCVPASGQLKDIADREWYYCTNWAVSAYCKEWSDGVENWDRSGCKTCFMANRPDKIFVHCLTE